MKLKDTNLLKHEFRLGLQEYITQKALVEELRLLAQSMSTQSALAKKIGISEQYLSDILHGNRDPGAAVCKFLKVEKVVMYQEVR